MDTASKQDVTSASPALDKQGWLNSHELDFGLFRLGSTRLR